MTEANPLALVVDDEQQIRRFLRAGLELDGFAVQEAESGQGALRLATLKPPDLVILDLGLPDMDGGDVLERLARLVDRAADRAVRALERGGEGAPARARR
jgi:two-component system, OmpR family, KDP operon response regulator KdpE